MQIVLELFGNVRQKRSRFGVNASRFCHRYRVAKSSTPPALLLLMSCP